MDTREELLEKLNGPDGLGELKKLCAAAPFPPMAEDVNNHIHTTFSFSPYSPVAAVYFARMAGLCTCGLVDHDSIAGAEEFLSAAEVAGIGATIGIECRVHFTGTDFASRKINNPDQAGVGYVLFHGVPHSRAAELNRAFAPFREKRNQRNRAMVAGVNGLLGSRGIELDFDRDVLPISEYARGGTVTERHISKALADRMLQVVGRGEPLIRFITDELGRTLSGKTASRLADPDNPFLSYDLLGWIKSDLISRFYIPATGECMHARDAVALAKEVGAIPAYSYLGDVGDSVTGDKRAQTFEDAYLEELVDWVTDAGFQALTYAPTRNTPAQIQRLNKLIRSHALMPISGEDINSPRQSFVCEAQRGPEFADLADSAWALIEHERRMDQDPAEGLFGASAVAACPDVMERMRAFAAAARKK